MDETVPTPETNSPIYSEVLREISGGIVKEFLELASESAAQVVANIAQLSSGLTGTFGGMLNQIFSGFKKDSEPVTQSA